jgi:hypothetical protein
MSSGDAPSAGKESIPQGHRWVAQIFVAVYRCTINLSTELWNLRNKTEPSMAAAVHVS